MSFEPFRSVILPKGKGTGLTPEQGTPVEPPTIILDGPALDADAIRAESIPASRSTSASRAAQSAPSTQPGSAATERAAAPAGPRSTTAVIPAKSAQATPAAHADTRDDEVGEEPPSTDAPGGATSTAEAHPADDSSAPEKVAPPKKASGSEASRRKGGGSGSTPRQFIVAYDGKLVGTYRSVKRIQNKTAYVKVAEQLVGQIADFDPSLIVLYKLTEVPGSEGLTMADLEESFESFPRSDVAAP